MRVAAALLLATAVSVLLKLGGLDAGYWIDEAIAVGIASHDLADIPGLLRQDGSPPLYYLLLHGWMAVAGTGEEATRALSLVFAAAAVPAAWWAAGRGGALVAAVCPFLSLYAQEARMYTLVALLSVVAAGAFARGHRRTLVAALVLLLYTHTWGIFLAIALVARSPDRRSVGPLVALLYLPWVPTLVFQALHTGAPWSEHPSVLWLVPVALLVAWRPRDELVLATAAGIALAWLVSQVTPAWSARYLFVFFGPVLLVLARRPAWAVAALAAAAVIAGAPEKSNARAVAASVAPSVRPGDLVVVTQPEQVPVLHRYLPAGVEYLTPLGRPADPSFTDWRDALRRIRRASAERVLLPRLEHAGRVVLVMPVPRDPRSAWARAVERRTREWRSALRSRLEFAGATSRPDPAGFRSAVRAEIYSGGA